jgi:AraC-like DNA-binding protein
MTFESTAGLLNWPLASALATDLPTPEGTPEWRGVVSVLSAIDELSNCPSLDLLLRQAVEVARGCVGLERVALYVADAAPSPLLRGTWGTGLQGETTDERGLEHSLCEADRNRLLEVQSRGSRWLFFERADLYNQEPGRSVVIGQGWLVITPLVSEGALVGSLYNDAALSKSPIDLGKQVRAAVFCSLLAGLILSRQKGSAPRAPVLRETERGTVVRQIQRAVNHNPMVSGEQLARELNISAGYLARVFKTEVGVSLVEYRNRLRIERFLRLVERGGGNLYEAAFEAGFGSYAQFHRVFRRHVGTTPREYVTGNRGLGSGSQFVATS